MFRPEEVIFRFSCNVMRFQISCTDIVLITSAM